MSTLVPSTHTTHIAKQEPDLTSTLARDWLLSFGSKNTRDAYARDLAHFEQFCRERDLELLHARRSHVDGYVRTLELEERSPSTIARRLASLSSFYRYAESEEVIARNPINLVKRPRVSNHSQTFGPNKDQVIAMLEAAEEAGARDHALILLLAMNGLRVSEAIALDAAHRSTERGHQVLDVHGKGGRIDRVAIPPLVADALDRLNIVDGPLITDSAGERLNRHQVTRIVKRVAKAAGIEETVSPHSLRHAAVTMALDANVPLHRVQDMARHADPRTTRRYDRARGQLDNHASYAIASHLTS